MRPGDRATIGPAAVSLGRQDLSLRVQAVSDPGLLPIYAGVTLLLAGLLTMISRFFWYERETAAILFDGRLLVGSRDEFFKKWGITRFYRWADSPSAPDTRP